MQTIWFHLLFGRSTEIIMFLVHLLLISVEYATVEYAENDLHFLQRERYNAEVYRHAAVWVSHRFVVKRIYRLLNVVKSVPDGGHVVLW